MICRMPVLPSHLFPSPCQEQKRKKFSRIVKLILFYVIMKQSFSAVSVRGYHFPAHGLSENPMHRPVGHDSLGLPGRQTGGESFYDLVEDA